MAGPMDLRGTVTVVDNATPTLNRIRNGLDSIARHAQQKAQAAATAVKGTTAAVTTGVGGYGLLGVLKNAEEFNRKVYGVGAAAISENTKRYTDETGAERVVVDVDKVRKSMGDVEQMSLRVAREMSHTPSRVAGIAEVLAKAGFGNEKLEAATRSLATVSSTDLETPVGKMAEFATILDTIYKPKEGETWAQFFKRQMDIVSVAANETRLSVGTLMEGMRPFSALFKNLGGNELDSTLLLMGGVKEGGEALEVGHTLKSNAVRIMRMSQEAQSRFSALGLKRSDYGDMSSIDPMRATGTLARLFPAAGMSGKTRKFFNDEYQKAIEGGYYGSDEFHDKMQAILADKAGADMSNEDSRSKFSEKYNNAVFGGVKVDMLKLLRDLIAKGASAGDLATIFEGRRIGTNIQIIEGLKKWGDEFTAKLQNATGVGVDATQQVYEGSSYGKLQRLYSMLEAFQIKLADSAGFEVFLSSITRFFDMLGQMPKPMADLVTTVGVLAVALAPLAVVLGVVAAGLMRLYGVLKWLKGAALAIGAAALPVSLASPVGAPVLGAAAAAGGGVVAGAAAKKAGKKLLYRFIPGVGFVLMGLGAYEAAKEYGKSGDAGRAMESFITGEPASAADPRQAARDANERALNDVWMKTPIPKSSTTPEAGTGAAPGDATPGSASVADETAQAMARAQEIIRGVDLTSEGQRIMESLANGLRAGIGSVDAAMNQAAESVRAGAARVRLNTGPAMRGAN